MKPKMILFDYGQTLVVEPQFDARRGYGAVYDRTDGGKVSRARFADFADAMFLSLAVKAHAAYHEIDDVRFLRSVCSYCDMQSRISFEDADLLYWDTATDGSHASPHAAEMLAALDARGIRTGIVRRHRPEVNLKATGNARHGQGLARLDVRDFRHLAERRIGGENRCGCGGFLFVPQANRIRAVARLGLRKRPAVTEERRARTCHIDGRTVRLEPLADLAHARDSRDGQPPVRHRPDAQRQVTALGHDLQ